MTSFPDAGHPPKPIRVLHLIFTLEGGGAEQQLCYLTHHTDPTWVENAICLFDDKGVEKVKTGTNVFVIERDNRFDFCTRKVREVYQTWKPDLIHIWLPSMLIYGIPAAVLGKNCIVKVIAGFRGSYKLNSLKRLLQILFLVLVDRIVSNIPDVCLNPPYKQLFKMKGGRLIPNGFPIQDLFASSAANRAEGKAPEEFRLLYVGRLNPIKNIPLLFKVLRILLSRGIRCKLVLAGAGSQKEELTGLCREMNLEGSIQFLGYQENITQLMGKSDLLVLPSFREGMSNSLFEALAFGLPVAVSDIPVHRYWLDHDQNAFLFDPRDPAGLADLIETIINKPESELQMIVDAAQDLVGDLSVNNMAVQYQNFYWEISSDEK